jgi:hypothetical protein
MKDLIKAILREYTKKDIITLEEIFLPDDFLETLIAEGNTTVNIPRGLEKNLNNYIKEKFNWPPNVNSVWCSDIKEKENLEKKIVTYSCNKKFTFNLGTHWLKRLFRVDEPEYKKGGKWEDKKIKNPGTKEGIDLFFKSKEKINDFIDGQTSWVSSTEKNVLLSFGDFQQILSIRKELIGKGSYFVTFISQIKGERFFDTPELKKITYL